MNPPRSLLVPGTWVRLLLFFFFEAHTNKHARSILDRIYIVDSGAPGTLDTAIDSAVLSGQYAREGEKNGCVVVFVVWMTPLYQQCTRFKHPALDHLSPLYSSFPWRGRSVCKGCLLYRGLSPNRRRVACTVHCIRFAWIA